MVNLYVIFNEKTKDFARTYPLDLGGVYFYKKSTTQSLKDADQFETITEASNFLDAYKSFYPDCYIKEVN